MTIIVQIYIRVQHISFQFHICLDPCFNQGQKLSGLSRGDGQFVDVIHTNSGALGQRRPSGDVDFYPNGNEII